MYVYIYIYMKIVFEKSAHRLIIIVMSTALNGHQQESAQESDNRI